MNRRTFLASTAVGVASFSIITRRAEAAEPAPVGAAAWQNQPDAEPVILRCGLDRPEEFVVGAPIQVVEPVQWFELTDADITALAGLDTGTRLGPDPDERDNRPRTGFSNVGGRWAPA